MRLIFLGPPGSGKGTQAKLLAQNLNLDHISTGDILRKAISENTELGNTAKLFMDAGQYVPDDIVLGLIKEELTKREKGFIFDGFPRTLPQAEGLDMVLKELGMGITKVINLALDDASIVKRLTARRVCKANGHEFNLITKPPQKEGICDLCGSELYKRTDDSADVINNRLEVYHEKTQPVEDFYRSRGLLIDVDGNKGFEEVYSSVADAVTKENDSVQISPRN
jgi:adenylate kinase